MNSFNQQFPYARNYYPMNNGITWVNGLEGAKAYQLAPNSNAQLMDSENDGVFYIKVSDNVGMCTLRKFRYQEEIDTPAPTMNLSDYVRKDELQALIQQLQKGVEHEQSVSTVKSNKKSITE